MDDGRAASEVRATWWLTTLIAIVIYTAVPLWRWWHARGHTLPSGGVVHLCVALLVGCSLATSTRMFIDGAPLAAQRLDGIGIAIGSAAFLVIMCCACTATMRVTAKSFLVYGSVALAIQVSSFRFDLTPLWIALYTMGQWLVWIALLLAWRQWEGALDTATVSALASWYGFPTLYACQPAMDPACLHEYTTPRFGLFAAAWGIHTLLWIALRFHPGAQPYSVVDTTGG